MRSYFSLTKTFLTAVGMSEGQDRKRKVFIFLLCVFAALFIMLPACLFAGGYMGLLTNALMENGSEALGLELMFHIISFFTILFGINVVLNEFYFSNDIQFLLPWPLRASKIVSAKFTAAFLMENLMQILLVASCVVGYGLAAKIDTLSWVYSILGVLTLPVLPMAYCGIISILVMGLTRFIKNKDTMQHISVAVIVVLLLALVGSIGSLRELNMVDYVEAMVNGDRSFFHIMDILFPNIYFFTIFFTEKSLSALVWYVVVNAAAIAVMLGLSELLYYKGVVSLSSGSSKKDSREENVLIAKSKMRSPFWSYFIKEVRILVRTPTFFTHCVLANFIWPLFVFAAYKLRSKPFIVADYHAAYMRGDASSVLPLLLGLVALSLVVAAMNSISSSSLSREGKHFSFMKYIPVSYETQWTAKLLIGFIFPFFSIIIFFWPACAALGLPFTHVLELTLICALCVAMTTLIGLCIDANQPKLIWDDELNALRENYNNFFTMSIAIAFAVLLCVGGYHLNHNAGLSTNNIMHIILGSVVVLNLLLFAVTKATVTKNIESQEEA